MALVFKINGDVKVKEVFERALDGSGVSIGDSDNESEFFIIIGDYNKSDIEVEVTLREEITADIPDVPEEEKEKEKNEIQEESDVVDTVTDGVVEKHRPRRKKHKKKGKR